MKKTIAFAGGIAAAAGAAMLAMPATASAANLNGIQLNDYDVNVNTSALTATDGADGTDVTVTAEGAQMCYGPAVFTGKISKQDLRRTLEQGTPISGVTAVDQSQSAAVLGDAFPDYAGGALQQPTSDNPYTATFDLSPNTAYTAMSMCFGFSDLNLQTGGVAHMDINLREINYTSSGSPDVFGSLGGSSIFGS